jgi:tetratricopeptide (TPR) repeat protein
MRRPLAFLVTGVLAASLAGAFLAAAPSTETVDRAAAERLLDRIIAQERAQQARDRAEADRLVTAAMTFMKQGDRASAQETLDRALRLDPSNAAGLSLQAALKEGLGRTDEPAAEHRPAARPVAPGEVETQLRVALIEGRRLLNDGQPIAAVEVLENAQRAIDAAPAGLNLEPYRVETASYLAAARDSTAVKPKVPTVWNPEGTRRRGELGPVPAPVATEDERRSVTNDRARFWAKPSTYNEEFDFAVGQLAVQPIGPPPLIRYPADWKEKSERRLAESTLWPQWYTDLKAKLALPLKAKVDFKGATLAQALDTLRNLHGVPLVVDPAATKAGLDQAKVTFEAEGISLGAALNLVADQTGADYTLRDEVVLFTTKERAKTLTVPKAYYIADVTYPQINWLEWRPLVPPQPWEANPWWDRYLDYWERWGGGWGGGNTGGYGGNGPYPPFWPTKYLETREQRAERLFDMIDRVIGAAQRQ